MPAMRAPDAGVNGRPGDGCVSYTCCGGARFPVRRWQSARRLTDMAKAFEAASGNTVQAKFGAAFER